MDPEDAKEELRRAIRQQRNGRTVKQRTQAESAFADVVWSIPEVREAAVVGMYAARAAEPATGQLMDRLAERGTRVLLPVLGAGLARDWADYTGPEDLLERAPGRPPEPGGPTLGQDALKLADVVVAPALAVDSRGVRLGQGGGWYDRVLTYVRPGAMVVAVVFPEEVYDAAERPLPSEQHDIAVHAVATTDTWHHLAP
ncbi:5-formyltetrahydrofolate cyclo-ligase [Myceligenerans cantabricum]